MIKFTSTKINGKAKKGDKNEKEYKNYPIKSFSFEDIWAGFSAKPPKQEKITRCVIVSAYTDLDWIHQAVQYIQEHKKGCVEIRFYLDFFASKFSILPDVKKQMIKLNKEIRKMDPNGGIFLVKKGQLFHSKIIITQTEKRCKVIVGYINFTKKAFEGNEEIALVDDFDDMTKALKVYVELRSKQQEELSASNIAMMQAQLNPHFLYNTLDSIKWIGKANHIPELATLSSSLAKILRASISADIFVPLADEIKLVDYYVEIQKIRFSGKFSYDAEVPMELEDVIVPKLILQPIVENAIVHGLKEREDGYIFLNAATMRGSNETPDSLKIYSYASSVFHACL